MMATCKDCIHYEVCAEEGIYFTEKYIKGATVSNDVKSLCHWFKNKLDYAKVKHGEWMQEWEHQRLMEDYDEVPYIKCSLCGQVVWNLDRERNTTPNYCETCGAKMDGGKAE